ncbi:MAG: hypothetical protein PWP76_100 [Candidatus Diapherotrites archaeon]|nr:hypothetical protein [Candidatus Diapherotrites archaeon]MDN5366794.1 hypothetical protein [Candidatus Diapherotrites archaeon]
MADVQKTYSLVAAGFVLALVAGFAYLPLLASVGSAGRILLAILAFVPLFIVMYRPGLGTYLLFAAVTEGYVLSIVPVLAAAYGPIVFGIVAGGALAFAVAALVFNEREVGESAGRAAFALIVIALIGSLALVIGSFFQWYSYELDLVTTVIALIAFLLFAAYDASKVRQYPDEYRAAVQLLIDLVGIVVELLRLFVLTRERE